MEIPAPNSQGFLSFYYKTQSPTLSPVMELFGHSTGWDYKWGRRTPPFRVRMLTNEEFTIVHMICGEVTVRRTLQQDYRSPRDVFLMANNGSINVSDGKEHFTVAAGEGCYLPPGAQEITVELGPGHNEILLLQVTLPTTSKARPATKVTNGTFLRLAFSSLVTIVQSTAPDNVLDASITTQSVLYLHNILLEVIQADPSGSPMRKSLMGRARWAARTGYLDPEFSSSDMARLCGVPLRTLQHHLRKHRTTPSKLVQDIRRRKALDLIRALPTEDYATIAAKVGLKTAAEVKRLIKDDTYIDIEQDSDTAISVELNGPSDRHPAIESEASESSGLAPGSSPVEWCNGSLRECVGLRSQRQG